MREYNLEGFVLRRFSLGEADRILTVFSREKGKIKLVAKGVRRGKAKLAGHLEPFCEVRLRVIKGKSLDIIIGAEATKHYDITSLEQDALSSAYLMCEILDRMLPEEQPNEPAFELLQSSLTSITNAVPAVLARQYFALKFLQTSGSQPDLSGTRLGSRHYLVYESGEIATARPNTHYGIISDETIKFWRLIYTNPLNQVARVGINAQILDEGEKLLMRYYEYHFSLKFKSLKVFQD